MFSLLRQFSGQQVKLDGIKKQKRQLNLHEHISYSILSKYGIPVPKFGVANTPQEANKIATELGSKNLIMKAQVLTGGRGKGEFLKSRKAGVLPINSPMEAEKLAAAMIGDTIITKQTGPKGKICNSVMIAENKVPKKELYLSVLMERAFHGPIVISSEEGGVEIESTAQSKPNAIHKTPVDIIEGLNKKTAETIVSKIGLEKEKEEASSLLLKMYDLMIKSDALLVEINPLIVDQQGKMCCLDAKINFDDNAEFRQKEIFSKRDFSQENWQEIEAAKYNLNFIALDGNIGCMVNGAGLAMATLDIIKLSGGEPANFLDVGGGATVDQVKEAFKIISADPKVSAILVNIFGGIMRCDIIAQGILAAVRELNLNLPLVCRLQGTRFKEAKEIIAASGLKLIASDDLTEAASVVVKLAQIFTLAREAKINISYEIQK